jgi:hypothetical protein
VTPGLDPQPPQEPDSSLIAPAAPAAGRPALHRVA